jgi:DNA modification methylase
MERRNTTYTTRQVADIAEVHKDTLLRWLREGRVPEPGRDRNGWRVFTPEEVEVIIQYAKGGAGIVAERSLAYTMGSPYAEAISRLGKFDWDFVDANTGYLTHSIHPYPAKFIPQIPNTLIQELSSFGERVLDPFCGSGTTLVEARRLGRHAVGVDANPLACLISRAKANPIRDSEAEMLYQLVAEIEQFAQKPFSPEVVAKQQAKFKGIDDWFDRHVIDELAFIKGKCLRLKEATTRQTALTAFSSIIVAVSRQDSETRYVRRDKNIQPADTLKQFSRALTNIIQRSLQFSDEIDPGLTTQVHEANVLDCPDVGLADLVICSPPYPNAFSYHLYHRTRMLWLDMDQPKFKQQEIGSHRKYSRKGANAATAETFREELSTIFCWLRRHLRPNRHACFVIGNSILKGQFIKNDALLIATACENGFQVEANISRQLLSTKKYFNPKIGKIREEHIVILRNRES